MVFWYIYSFAAFTTINFRTRSSSPKETPYLLTLPVSPSASAVPPIYVFMDLHLPDISCIRS